MAKARTNKWYEAWQAYSARSILCVALAYTFASLAINSGSLLQYFIGIVLVGLAVKYTVQALKKFRHGD